MGDKNIIIKFLNPGFLTPKLATEVFVLTIGLSVLCAYIILFTLLSPIFDDKKAWKLLYENTPMIPIKRLKEIKNQFDVRFTSVMHACVASAMRKCIIQKYGEEKAKNFNGIPCFVVLPLPNHPLKLRNHCTGAYIHLPSKSLDVFERLRQCEANLVCVKRSTMPFVGKYLPVLGGSLISPLVKLIGKNRSFPVSLSNFPFGDSHFVICGKKALRITTAVGGTQGVIGLCFIMYSYVDSVQISIIAKDGVFLQEDLKLMSDAIVDEVELFYRHAVL